MFISSYMPQDFFKYPLALTRLNYSKLLACLLFVLIFACSACVKSAPLGEDLLAAKPRPVVEGISSDGLLITEGLTEKVLIAAYSQVGTPYKYGGTTPYKALDCSGFTRWVYMQNGIQLPRTSKAQFKVGREIEKSEIKPGDLLMYKRGRRGNGTHIGIYVGDGKYIHSPRRGKTVMESVAFNPHSSLYFLGARRVFEDPVLFVLSEEQKAQAKDSFVMKKDVEIKVVLPPSGKKALESTTSKTPKANKVKPSKEQASRQNNVSKSKHS